MLKSDLLPYWKEGGNVTRERFIRKFWENPDANDPDVTAAFRKRLDVAPKMTTRLNQNTLKTKLSKKQSMRKETVDFVVLKLLPTSWKREATK